jgi:hypothetical protein
LLNQAPRNKYARALRPVLWGTLALWSVALGVFYVTRSARAAPVVGDRDLLEGLSGRTMAGRTLPLMPRDSAVAVLAATAECAACRVGIPNYREIALRLREQGVAFRVIMGSDSVQAAQFAKLIPQADAVLWDPDQKLFRKLGMHVVPTLYLVGRDGRVHRTWSPLPPSPRTPMEIAEEARTASGAGRTAVR